MTDKVHCTIVHSVPANVTKAEAERIKQYYGHAAYGWWQPGQNLGIDSVHFTRSQPAADRNGIEDWKGHLVRFVSYTMVMVELTTGGS